MGTAITYYLVNGKKLDFETFEKLNDKPSLPIVKNFNNLKFFVEQNTSENNESEIIINTTNNDILINLK